MRLGEVSLGWGDVSPAEARRARGPFVPSEAYDLVRPIFQLLVSARRLTDAVAREEALQRYEKARSALKLALRDASGRNVPVRAIHLLELGPAHQTNGLQVDIHI